MERAASIAGVRERIGRLRAPHGVLARLMLAGLVVTAIVAALAVVVETALSTQRDAARAVTRTDEVLATSYLVERNTIDLETGLRGYEATGDRLFLAPWTSARSILPGQLAGLRREVAADRLQEGRAAALQAAIDAYIADYGDQIIGTSHLPTGHALESSLASGKDLFDALRTRFNSFDATAQALDRRQEARAAQTDSTIAVLTAVAAAAVVAALIGLLIFVFQGVVVPLRRVIAACARVSRGERDVSLPADERTELGQLGTAFNAMVGDLRRREHELSQAAERAREAEERFRQAFVSAPIGMVLSELDGRIVRVNEALCEITGYSHEELRGLTTASITHPDDREIDAVMLASLLSGATDEYQREKRYVRRSGEPVWISKHVTILRDRDGNPCQLLGQAEDITLRRESEARLRHLADHDGLTGLLNRGRFGRELDTIVARARRYGERAALLMIDLDHFKVVNDTYGHAQGDELISRVAAAIRDQLRETDVAGRLGGDEFAVVLPHAEEHEARQVAARLLAALRTVAHESSLGGEVTASVGVAEIAPRTELSADEVLIKADRAMYEAKQGGRDRVRSRVG